MGDANKKGLKWPDPGLSVAATQAVESLAGTACTAMMRRPDLSCGTASGLLELSAAAVHIGHSRYAPGPI